MSLVDYVLDSRFFIFFHLGMLRFECRNIFKFGYVILYTNSDELYLQIINFNFVANCNLNVSAKINYDL